MREVKEACGCGGEKREEGCACGGLAEKREKMGGVGVESVWGSGKDNVWGRGKILEKWQN